jgi:hypothetical protein
VRRGTLLAALLAAAGPPLYAQEVSALLGGVHAKYADSISGTAATVALRLGGSSSRAVGVVDVSLARFLEGGWITQGSGYGTLIVSNNRGDGLNLALAGGLNGNYPEGGYLSGSGAVGPVVALSRGPLLSTIGGSVGIVRDVAETSFITRGANTRIRLQLGGGYSIAAGAVAVAGDTMRYLDGTVEFAFESSRLDAALTAGARTGDLADDPWIQGRLTVALTPLAVIELAAGSYPRDLVGFEHGVYASAGFRVNLTRAAREPYVAAPVAPLAARQLESGRVLLRIHFETAGESVAIAGDWANWDALPLRRVADDIWEIALELGPGIYRYSLVVDGETWTLPSGAMGEPDGFGGQVGLLVVR